MESQENNLKNNHSLDNMSQPSVSGNTLITKRTVFSILALLFLLGIFLLLLFFVYPLFKNKAIQEKQILKTSQKQINATAQPHEKKSGADISYIEVYAGAKTNITLFGLNGEELAKGEFEGPLQDPVSEATNGDGLMTIYYSKPNSGEYLLEISGIDKTGLQIILYDKNGEEVFFNFSKEELGKSKKIRISYHKENLKLSTVAKE